MRVEDNGAGVPDWSRFMEMSDEEEVEREI